MATEKSRSGGPSLLPRFELLAEAWRGNRQRISITQTPGNDDSDLTVRIHDIAVSIPSHISEENKMSWQAYIDTSLVGSGHIDKAAIIDAAGASSWAASAGFTLKPEEMTAIANILSGNAAAKDGAFADGLYIGGERFVMTKAEDRSLYARKGNDGVAIAKTKQAIIIGHHNKDQIAGNATSTVETLADYLIGQNY
ncbi:Putative Profilin [[Torrubiella] hemipterigena]|uniref:Profilin n=1 Tax=[Torrubiella] hemipterigena TaxID=1531966 RepID=A0A0A1TDF3_9HYPO|nr:Putative Profilin [[Torrubiella] hemipterigena]